MHYKSCDWIENGISFDVDSYKVCCLYSAIGGGNTIVKNNYNGEPIDWMEFFNYKKTIKNKHKQGNINPKCLGCINLIDKEWDSTGNNISFINLDYWTKCNSNCFYCYTSKDKYKYNQFENYNFLPILEDMIEKKILLPDGHVSFGGGEVTLLPEFESVLNKFIDFGFQHIKIHTSCIQYSKAIERGLQQGVIELIVSVDSGSKELHKKIKQVDSYDVVWNNLEMYCRSQNGNSRVKTKYIVIPSLNDSIEEIDLWLNKSKQIGVTSVIQEIESEWFYKRRDSVPKQIIEYFDYTNKNASSLGLNYELYERAEHMISFNNDKNKNIIFWHIKKLISKIYNILKKIKTKLFSFFSLLC